MGIWSALKAVPGAAAAAIGGGLGLAGDVGTAVASAKEAQKNRDFQERLSNTAYQRAATDLEAAGLNRILALGSPASTPGGAVATFPNFGSSITGGASAIANTAMQANVADKQANKLVTENRVLTQKQKQEVQKTALWREIAPLIVRAAGQFNDLLGMLTDGAIPKLLEKVGNISDDARAGIDIILQTSFPDEYKKSGLHKLMINEYSEKPFHKGSTK